MGINRYFSKAVRARGLVAAAFLPLAGCGNAGEAPQTHLNALDVQRVTGCFFETVSKSIKDEFGNYASYSCKQGKDGKTFDLSAVIYREGQNYKTSVHAELVGSNVYDIKSIVFDNKVEKLRNAKEIFTVLGYIGNNHVRTVATWGTPMRVDKNLPFPHQEKGDFSQWGRFTTRVFPKIF